MIRPIIAMLGALWLAGCGASADSGHDWPEPSPALWEVTSPAGETGWLFGTIHALPDGVAWQTPLFDQTLAQAGVVMLEIAQTNREGGTGTFMALAQDEPVSPLLDRFPAAERVQVTGLIEQSGMSARELSSYETWGAALVMANAISVNDPANGADRAIAGIAPRTSALETIESQLRIFDALPETEQQDLLLAIAAESARNRQREGVAAWISGDLAVIETASEQGIMGDPELREALHAVRNRTWLPAITRAIDEGQRPLVAVGAAHMLGDDGLPALLTANGYTVRRIQ